VTVTESGSIYPESAEIVTEAFPLELIEVAPVYEPFVTAVEIANALVGHAVVIETFPFGLLREITPVDELYELVAPITETKLGREHPEFGMIVTDALPFLSIVGGAEYTPLVTVTEI